MKRILVKTYGSMIATLLGLISFLTGCNTINEPKAEYGTPHADFVVKGKITDKATENPINNMAVINKPSTSPHGNDTVRTNAEGNYELKFTATSFGAEDLTIYASDTEGTENGSYISDTIRIKASELKQIAKNGGSWYFGKFEKTGTDFQLDPGASPLYGVPSATYKKIEEKK